MVGGMGGRGGGREVMGNNMDRLCNQSQYRYAHKHRGQFWFDGRASIGEPSGCRFFLFFFF